MAKEKEEESQGEAEKVFSRWYRPSRSMTIKYDDIVDRSKFVTTAETKRGLVAGRSGAGDKGLYDYEDGKIPDEKERLTEVELLLRSGKLDKADVQRLRNEADQNLLNERDKQLLAQEDKAAKNRKAALDKLLDVNQETESK